MSEPRISTDFFGLPGFGSRLSKVLQIEKATLWVAFSIWGELDLLGFEARKLRFWPLRRLIGVVKQLLLPKKVVCEARKQLALYKKELALSENMLAFLKKELASFQKKLPGQKRSCHPKKEVGNRKKDSVRTKKGLVTGEKGSVNAEEDVVRASGSWPVINRRQPSGSRASVRTG